MLTSARVWNGVVEANGCNRTRFKNVWEEYVVQNKVSPRSFLSPSKSVWISALEPEPVNSFQYEYFYTESVYTPSST